MSHAIALDTTGTIYARQQTRYTLEENEKRTTNKDKKTKGKRKKRENGNIKIPKNMTGSRWLVLLRWRPCITAVNYLILNSLYLRERYGSISNTIIIVYTRFPFGMCVMWNPGGDPSWWKRTPRCSQHIYVGGNVVKETAGQKFLQTTRTVTFSER